MQDTIIDMYIVMQTFGTYVVLSMETENDYNFQCFFGKVKDLYKTLLLQLYKHGR